MRKKERKDNISTKIIIRDGKNLLRHITFIVFIRHKPQRIDTAFNRCKYLILFVQVYAQYILYNILQIFNLILH